MEPTRRYRWILFGALCAFLPIPLAFAVVGGFVPPLSIAIGSWNAIFDPQLWSGPHVLAGLGITIGFLVYALGVAWLLAALLAHTIRLIPQRRQPIFLPLVIAVLIGMGFAPIYGHTFHGSIRYSNVFDYYRYQGRDPAALAAEEASTTAAEKAAAAAQEAVNVPPVNP